jgi:hypothetical protein
LGALPGEGVSIRLYFPRQLFNRWRSEKCWLAISHLNTLPPIFGQINPTLDILFDLAWQSVCSSFFRPTPIPFREWLVLRDLVRRGDAIRDKIQLRVGKKIHARQWNSFAITKPPGLVACLAGSKISVWIRD